MMLFDVVIKSRVAEIAVPTDAFIPRGANILIVYTIWVSFFILVETVA